MEALGAGGAFSSNLLHCLTQAPSTWGRVQTGPSIAQPTNGVHMTYLKPTAILTPLLALLLLHSAPAAASAGALSDPARDAARKSARSLHAICQYTVSDYNDKHPQTRIACVFSANGLYHMYVADRYSGLTSDTAELRMVKNSRKTKPY